MQPSGEVVIKNMVGDYATNYVGDGVRTKRTVGYTQQNEASRTFTIAPSYLNEATYVRVRGYNNLSGKWSPYITMTIYNDYYKATLTAKAPRKDLAQPQCEVPYFVSGVYTHYYSSQGSKVGQKIIGLRCKLIRDEESASDVRGGDKVSPTDAGLDKGRLKAFGEAGTLVV